MSDWRRGWPVMWRELQLEGLMSSLHKNSSSFDLLQIVELFGSVVDGLRGLILSSGGYEAAGEKCQFLYTNINSLTVLLTNTKQSVQANKTSSSSSLCITISSSLKVIMMILQFCKEVEVNHELAFETLAAVLGSVFKSTISLLKVTCDSVELIKPHPLMEDGMEEAISNVISSLFPMVQVSLQFDPAVVLMLWKSLGKLVCHVKDRPRLLGNGCHGYRDIVRELCNAMLVKGREAVEVTTGGSLGESGGAFSKLLKLCRFFATLIVKIIQEYDSYHHLISETVFNFLLELMSLLPPSPSCSKSLPQQVLSQLEANVSVVSEPLFSCLMNCEEFLNLLTTSSDITSRHSYSWCCLLCSLMKSFQKLEATSHTYLLEPITAQEKPTSDTNRIFKAIFDCTSSCHMEFSLPVNLPGTVPIGQPLVDVSLYENFCVHVCSIVALLPAGHFNKLERVLLFNLFSDDFYCSLLSLDVWSFMARWSSSEICFSHVELLSNLILTVPDDSSLSLHNVKCLFWRLFAFLTPQQQELFLKKCTPPSSDNISLWSTVPLYSLSPPLINQVCSSLCDYCIGVLVKDTLFSLTMIRCLKIVYNLLSGLQCRPHPLTHLPTLVDVVMKLLSCCVQESTKKQMKSDYLSITNQLLSVISLLLTDMSKDQIIKVLNCTYWMIAKGTSKLPIAGVATLLSSCGSLHYPSIKDSLCTLFVTLFSAELPWLQQQLVLESFKQFAETTPFSDILEKCIPPAASSTIIDFIQKIPHGCNGHPQLLEIKNIAQILLEQRKTFLEGKGIENLIEEEEDGADATMETERNEMCSGQGALLLSQLSEAWSHLRSHLLVSPPITHSMTEELRRIERELKEYID